MDGRLKLRVLSIDWDYLVNASALERMTLFPDGGNENLSQTLGNIIWSSRYANPNLRNIKTDTGAIRKLKKYLKGLRGDVQCMIAESHKHAYDFVLELLRDTGADSVELVNLDYHHDVYQNGDSVDCGNWLAKLMEELEGTDSSFTWVSREDSDGIDESYTVGSYTLNHTTDISYATSEEWDAVFICRSDMWSPPHLDTNFGVAFDWVLNTWTTRVQRGIFDSRYPAVRRFVAKDRELMMSLSLASTFTGE